MASGPGQHNYVSMGNTSWYAYLVINKMKALMILTRTAGVVRDTVYIDGGYLWWEPGLADGTYGSPVSDGTGKAEFSIQI
jgi:hypothetical protein